jgi:hypothetical protein
MLFWEPSSTEEGIYLEVTAVNMLSMGNPYSCWLFHWQVGCRLMCRNPGNVKYADIAKARTRAEGMSNIIVSTSISAEVTGSVHTIDVHIKNTHAASFCFGE